ncbi:MAG: hypothetical protein KDD05_04405 [Psychroserpens sp.]|nr:hypothetical protein [Psychroserpens sp.]
MRGKIVLLVIISFILTNVVAFLDEGIQTFDYLNHVADWFALILYTILFLIFPLVIFYRTKYSVKRKFEYALLGFIPVVLLILLQLK